MLFRSKVAVIKQMDHASLDEIANAITARLDAIAEENGITIEYEVTSGQGDQTVLRQLSDQAIADGVDAIIPIATTAAQVAAVSAEESKTPVIFAAISYPETVELTGMDYVTGTSDALDTYAKSVGMKTIGWVGFDGGAISQIADIVFHVPDRKSTRLNSSHSGESRMPSSA